MKKISFKATLLLFFYSATLFAYSFHDETEQYCVLGNPKLRLYANLIEKTKFSPDDSFQKEYYRYHRGEVNIEERIQKQKIACSMKHIPYVSHNRIICKDSQTNGYYVTQTPCVTEDMIDYVYWGVNEALRCFSDYMDSFTEDMIFKEIHQESSFGFFLQYDGGDGIMQLVSYGKNAMYKQKQLAHQFLVEHIFSHPQQCSSFNQIVWHTPSAQYQRYSNCEFVSLGDGMGRNLLAGIGLYMYYRSAKSNPQSAENMLAHWGYYKTSSDLYKKARAYITAGMYNKGPNAVFSELNYKIKPKGLLNMTELQKYNTIMNLIDHSSFISYIRGMERTSKIFDNQGRCMLPTFDELAYQR